MLLQFFKVAIWDALSKAEIKAAVKAEFWTL